MAESFPLEIVTPESGSRVVNCTALTVTLCDGEACFLKGHAPFLGILPPGKITVSCDASREVYEIAEAFLKVTSAGTELFTERCLPL